MGSLKAGGFLWTHIPHLRILLVPIHKDTWKRETIWMEACIKPNTKRATWTF